jgi:hypothetical protein
VIEVEYIDNGKRVIIPAEVWDMLKELAEHVQVYELVRQRRVFLEFTLWTSSSLTKA